MKSPSQVIARQLMVELKQFEPFIHAISKDRHSVYIHFNKLPKGMTHKLRVSNHPEREKYGYKWQLRLDGIPPVREHKQYSRYFDDVAQLVNAFDNYYKKVEENAPS